MPNRELMRLWDTYLGPASDTLLDLGASNFRWLNLWLSGTMSSNAVSTNSVNLNVLNATTAQITGLASTGITIGTARIATALITTGQFVGFVGTGLTVSSSRTAVLTGSSLILSNSSRAYINANILITTAAMVSGDVWFMSSSNRMYLATRSGNFTYYAVMNT